MTLSWKEELHQHLVKKLGKKTGGALAKKYLPAFPMSFCEQRTIQDAVNDIIQIEKLSKENPLRIDLYKIPDTDFPLHLKLYQYGQPVSLSDILPMIENMNLRTYSERPYEITLGKNTSVWISDFSVTYSHVSALNIPAVENNFEEAFTKIYFGVCENDGFNKLILITGLSWREVTIIRAYAKYLHQTGFRFSQSYIEKTVEAHAEIVKDLITLFNLKFSLKGSPASKDEAELDNKIQSNLDAITSLDEDRIMRRFWSLIKATLRTNYFQTLPDGSPKNYLSFKLDSAEIPELPLPLPLYEVFVYSPRFEGIHLRSAKVARGGIRWSERPEDFRTEVLGLMKAQKVKNSVIVPSGAKGGFVLKLLSALTTRELLNQEVIFCYKSFIRGLLDLTDNLKNNKIIPPRKTICYDDPDPYLVVAADKGTATFSDIANSISKEYDFWLGDAFASGGSAGYDHKKMGITARGAWESIKRHFREINLDFAKQDFTVVGIGDMSGDVFGNGMIYSNHIQLVAAFDHRHIFLDPTPNASKTYEERVRLFNLPMSSWEDFNPKLISAGGGVHARSTKSITITPQVKKALGIENNALTPNELIQAILKAPVVLLFNGGIGTYVKASTETHAEVGDKTNEFCRVNGKELRCQMVGEGGNLGFTQLGRIEYALNGGIINTDFIDNSGGVDCSDHEVNIKILLSKEVHNGNLTEKKRNQLLFKMTDDVAHLVLKDNYNQALVMSFSSMRTVHYTGLYQNYIKELEVVVHLDRAVEFLPDDKTLLDRKAAGQGLTRPELAVLLAYTKIHIKNELLKSDLPDDPYFVTALESAFPRILAKTYLSAMEQHRLRREIIATQLSNQIVNAVGITFVYRLQTETGASIAEITRAYTVASKVYETEKLHQLVDSLNLKVSIQHQYELLHHIRQLLNLATRWFLRGKRLAGNIEKIIEQYAHSVAQLEALVQDLMIGITKKYLDSIVEQFVKAGLEESLAKKIAVSRGMYTALNITEVAACNKLDLVKTAAMYFEIGNKFNLVWFRDQIATDAREGHWNTMARLALRDELDSLQRRLSLVILQSSKKDKNAEQQIMQWLDQNPHVQHRWERLLEMLHGSSNIDYTMFFIALRELSDMVQFI
jgi:glutamate dehydrogenase